MVKRKILLIVSLIVLFLTTLSSVVYAWFLLTEKTPPIIVYLGKIEAGAHLYQIENEIETEINSLIIESVVPGATYDYKLIVKNKGTISGDLDIIFAFEASENSLLPFGLFKQVSDQAYQDFSSDYEILAIELDPYMVNEDLVTIYFTVKISEDLELSHLSGNDFLKIASITIKLVQQPPNLG